MPDRFHLTTLHGRKFEQDPLNLVQMLKHLAVLDELCRTLGVSRFSEFVDISLLELEEAAELVARDASPESEADPETGMVLAIEDLDWHPAAIGMASLEASAQHLERGVSDVLDQVEIPALLAELRRCQLKLQPLEAEGGQFHFAVRNE